MELSHFSRKIGFIYLVVFLYSGLLGGHAVGQSASSKDASGPKPTQAPSVFPIKTISYDASQKPFAQVFLYPRYAELHDLNQRPLGKAGVVQAKGFAQIVLESYPPAQTPRILATSFQLQIFDASQQALGFFIKQGGLVYSYDKNRTYLGKVFCLVDWEVCGAISTAALLNVFSR